MRLTKANVAKLSLPEGKSELLVFDEALAGFGIRLRYGGKRTWIAQYRLGSKQRRLSLGSTETLDAEEARRRAKSALSKVNLGTDPQTEKAHGRLKASVTIGATVETYLARREGRLTPNFLADVRRYLRVHWAPLHEVAVHSVTRSMVAARLAEIATGNGLYAANRARAALSAFYSWAIGEGLANENPVVGTNKPVDEISRDRVLNADELRLAWDLAGAGDFGAIVRLLVLTGQRREEVGGMLWSELDLDAALWTIGKDRTKNGLQHDVPLSPPAVAILRGVPRRDNRDFVFGSSNGPFQGWSNAKAALDVRMTKALGAAKGISARPSPWRLHDIRRTVAT
ncbi:MAG: integrase arm-type DNA-binding domain-containing protein, partial [Roseiarcus sp.]